MILLPYFDIKLNILTFYSHSANIIKLHVLLTAHYDIKFIPVTNLMHTFLYLYNVQSCTCFEQYYVHPQEVKLYVYSTWYRHSLRVVVVVVQYTG